MRRSEKSRRAALLARHWTEQPQEPPTCFHCRKPYAEDDRKRNACTHCGGYIDPFADDGDCRDEALTDGERNR